MKSMLEILFIGLLFYSGHGAPVEKSEDYPADGDDKTAKSQYKGVIVTEPQVFVAQLNDEVMLPCKIVNYNEEDDEAIIWSFRSPSANESKSIFVDTHPAFENNVYSVDRDHTLHIKNFNANLSGSYVCELSFQKTKVTHILGMKESPMIENLKAKKYVDINSSLQLTCEARGFPQPVISWEKKANESSDPVVIGSGAKIEIKSVTANDAGIYTCIASVNGDRDTKSVTVHVISGIAPESAIVYAGEAEGSTRLCCVFDKMRELTWLKDGKQLVMSDRYFEDKEKHKKCLVIKKIKEEDFGTYTCQTQKDYPEKADIQVIGAPSKPILKSVSSDSSKSPILTWDIHSLTPITNYQIQYKKPEDNEWINLVDKTLDSDKVESSISYTFSDLPNGRYDVKLRIMNRFGSNTSIDNSAVVVDRTDPNVIMSAKIGSGAESHFRISGLCVMLAIAVRLWSC